MKLEKLFRQYLFSKGKQPLTINQYLRDFTEFSDWCKTENLKLKTVSYNDIMAFQQYLMNRKQKQQPNKKLTLATVNRQVLAVRHFYDFLYEDRRLRNNPAIGIKIEGAHKQKSMSEPLEENKLNEIYKSYVKHQQGNINGKAKPKAHRNIIVMGLLFFQGLTARDVRQLLITDFNLQEGTVHVIGNKRRGERIIKLEAEQILPLMNYINEKKGEYLIDRDENLTALYMSQFMMINRFSGIRLNPPFIRACRIIVWLGKYNVRQVQYMAGLKTILALERYRRMNIDDLRGDVEKYFPLD